MSNIRNFVIIAHIDSGKSTLADRFLETTGTVAAREMRPQYLDQLDLERERGITIKMAPVRMQYEYKDKNDDKGNHPHAYTYTQSNSKYILNLIDTPGHSDFGYEVSRALAAVEGAVLLIDGTKGIQAQTLANLRAARRAGLAVIGAVNKIDLFRAQTDAERMHEVIRSVAELLGVGESEILKVSAKTGEGARQLLEAVVERVPPPRRPASHGDVVEASIGMAGRTTTTRNDTGVETETDGRISRALIFDSLYDDHKGIIAFVRMFRGALRMGDEVLCAATGAAVRIKEVGYFSPKFSPCEELGEGEIGYVATGLKEPAKVKIGDTVMALNNAERTRNNAEGIQRLSASGQRLSAWALPGYKEPQPVVFISFYPDGDTKFEDLERALARLKLNDAALSFVPESNEALGRGFKVGFLGQLHFEVAASRLTREFGLSFLTSFPSVAYRVLLRNTARQDADGTRTVAESIPRNSAFLQRNSATITKVVTQPQDFPDAPNRVWEPVIRLEIVVPPAYLNEVLGLQHTFEFTVDEIGNLGAHLTLTGRMPLRELIRDFDDRLKSASAGFASFNYELAGEVEGNLVKLEVFVAGEVVPALTRVVPAAGVAREARQTVERLKELLPRAQFEQAIQARAEGRILARETIPAMRKLLGNFGKTGGDRTRKMKLWKKQKEGKKKLLGMARVKLSPEVFREILKK